MARHQILKRILAVFAIMFALTETAAPQDFGDFGSFGQVEMNAPGSMKYMADPTGSAPTKDVFSLHIKSGYCSKSKYGDGVSNDCKFNSTRTSMRETVAKTNKKAAVQPKSAWYGFAVYFPKGDPFGKKQTKGHQDFAYWHNGHCAHLSFRNFAGQEDPLSLGTNIALGGYDCADGLGLKIASFSELEGHWSRFEVFVNWSTSDDGEAKVYLDGKYVVQYKGPTLTKGFEVPNYFVFGTYICCTSDVKNIKSHTVLYSAVKRAQSRDGLLVAEDKFKLKDLQATLQRIGCDPGNLSGELTLQTKQAAVSCKSFSKEVLPFELSAGSLNRFQTLYSAAGIESLSAGKLGVVGQDVAKLVYPDSSSQTQATGILPAKF